MSNDQVELTRNFSKNIHLEHRLVLETLLPAENMQRMDLSASWKLTILLLYVIQIATIISVFYYHPALSTIENICSNKGNESFVQPLFKFCYTNYRVFDVFREVQVEWRNWLARGHGVVFHLTRVPVAGISSGSMAFQWVYSSFPPSPKSTNCR